MMNRPFNVLRLACLSALLSALLACGGGADKAPVSAAGTDPVPAPAAETPNAPALPPEPPVPPDPALPPAPPTPADPAAPAPPPAPPAPAPVEPEPSGPGRLMGATVLSRIAAADIALAITAAAASGERAPVVNPAYEVANHRLIYLTLDGRGRTVTASGLVSVPVKATGARSPVISYQHGTTFKDADITLQTTFLDTYMADDDDAMERQSNVHDWKPDAPVSLYHGRDDQTVPYASATRTLQAMQARAAPQVSLTDCTATPADHLPCVVPYWTFMLAQLSGWARDL